MRGSMIRLKRERPMKPFERFLAVAAWRPARGAKRADTNHKRPIFRTLTLGTLNLGLAQAWLDSADDAQRDLVLKCEDVTDGRSYRSAQT